MDHRDGEIGNVEIPIILKLDEFDGGRFFRGRYVHSVSVSPAIDALAWWTHNSNAQTQDAILTFAKQCYATHTTEERGDRRNRRYAQVFTFHNDSLTQFLFGLGASQFFNRRLKQTSIVAIDRGKRNGWWYCESALLPLFALRKRRMDALGRIPVEFQSAFDRVLVGDGYEPLPNKFDYSTLDCGPDRLPPVWACNLCGRTAEWSGWPKDITPGVANSDYIASCPDCNAQRGDFFEQVKAALTDNKKAFSPVKKMQDQYYFTT